MPGTRANESACSSGSRCQPIEDERFKNQPRRAIGSSDNSSAGNERCFAANPVSWSGRRSLLVLVPDPSQRKGNGLMAISIHEFTTAIFEDGTCAVPRADPAKPRLLEVNATFYDARCTSAPPSARRAVGRRSHELAPDREKPAPDAARDDEARQEAQMIGQSDERGRDDPPQGEGFQGPAGHQHRSLYCLLR